MQQLGMFGRTPEHVEDVNQRYDEQELNRLAASWLARSSDPETSHAAARDIESSGLRASQLEVVYDLVVALEGQTSKEYSRRNTLGSGELLDDDDHHEFCLTVEGHQS